MKQLKSDDVSDPEQSRIKLEDTEEQTGWFPFLILHFFTVLALVVYG